MKNSIKAWIIFRRILIILFIIFLEIGGPKSVLNLRIVKGH